MTRARDVNLVRLRREQQGMLLVELAAAISRSPAFISCVEGGFVPRIQRRDQIAAALGTTAAELWPDEYPDRNSA